MKEDSISGETDIYGRVEEISSDQQTLIKLVSGEKIRCHHNGKVKAEFLYKEVGVSGSAEWNTEDLRLESFMIEDIWEIGDFPKEFQGLRKILSNVFRIEDVDRYVRDIRGE